MSLVEEHVSTIECLFQEIGLEIFSIDSNDNPFDMMYEIVVRVPNHDFYLMFKFESELKFGDTHFKVKVYFCNIVQGLFEVQAVDWPIYGGIGFSTPVFNKDISVDNWYIPVGQKEWLKCITKFSGNAIWFGGFKRILKQCLKGFVS